MWAHSTHFIWSQFSNSMTRRSERQSQYGWFKHIHVLSLIPQFCNVPILQCPNSAMCQSRNVPISQSDNLSVRTALRRSPHSSFQSKNWPPGSQNGRFKDVWLRRDLLTNSRDLMDLLEKSGALTLWINKWDKNVDIVDHQTIWASWGAGFRVYIIYL